MIFLLPFIGAFLFRLRGSSFDVLKSEQLTRFLVWAFPSAIVQYFLFSVPWWIIPIYTLGWFLGVALNPWGPYTSLGRNPGTNPKTDWFMMSLLGILVTIFPGLTLIYFHPLQGVLIMLSGTLMAPAYELGFRTLSNVPNLNNGREMGEVYTGFSVWLCMVLAKLFID